LSESLWGSWNNSVSSRNARGDDLCGQPG
jgi:hypothetical protein